jgi:hypothetical protein
MKQTLNQQIKPAFGPLGAILTLSTLLLILGAGFTFWSVKQAERRDQERIANLSQIQSAINRYFNENRHFPIGDKDDGNWDLGYNGPDDHRFINELVEKGFLSANFPADPLSKFNKDKGIDYTFRYQVYPDDGQFCPRGQGEFYVLGIRDLETDNAAIGEQPKKFEGSGFKCTNRDWQDEFDYVVGAFANPLKKK